VSKKWHSVGLSLEKYCMKMKWGRSWKNKEDKEYEDLNIFVDGIGVTMSDVEDVEDVEERAIDDRAISMW
jgi:hypothetical protein